MPTPGTAAAAVDDDGLAGGNAASTAGDLDANVGDLDGAASSEATFSGVLGGSVGDDGAGSNGFSFAGLDGQAGTVGQENVTYSWNAGSNTLTATTVGGTRPGTALFTVQVTDAATGAYRVTLLDNVLHAGGPNDESVATVGAAVLDHRRRRLDRQRHADRHLRRRCADSGGGGLAGRRGRRHGDRHAGLRRRRRRRHGDAHRRHAAGVRHGDGFSQAIDIGAGFLKVKADGSYSFTADAATRARLRRPARPSR